MTYINYENIYFFTATIVRWQKLLDNDEFKIIIVDSFRHFSHERCDFYSFVIMPNHIHVILQLKNDTKASFQRDFLKFTAQNFLKIMLNSNHYRMKDYRSDLKDRNFQIWKKNPFWVELSYPHKYYVKLEYIHKNPLAGKWRLADSILTYPWSSAKFHEGLDQPFDWLRILEW